MHPIMAELIGLMKPIAPGGDPQQQQQQMSRHRFIATYIYSFFALTIILLAIFTSYNVDEVIKIILQLQNNTCKL